MFGDIEPIGVGVICRLPKKINSVVIVLRKKDAHGRRGQCVSVSKRPQRRVGGVCATCGAVRWGRCVVVVREVGRL